MIIRVVFETPKGHSRIPLGCFNSDVPLVTFNSSGVARARCYSYVDIFIPETANINLACDVIKVVILEVPLYPS